MWNLILQIPSLFPRTASKSNQHVSDLAVDGNCYTEIFKGGDNNDDDDGGRK